MNKTGFPYEFNIEVAFRDIDAMGHVNNAVFFSYLETARIKFVTQFFHRSTLMEADLLSLPLILVEATCTYKSPAMLGEVLTLGVGLTRFGTKSFDLVYTILGEDGRLVAKGKTVQVMYDYGARSAFPIPADIKERVATFQKEWQVPEGN